jgi:hypothetical protein
MSITQSEVGRVFRLSTGGFDMSASTGLTLNFTKPDGTTLTKTEASVNPVTAPAVALVNDPDLGNQATSTYFEFTSVAADFDQPGTWTVCGIYTDATPKVYHTESPPKEFEVLEACS